MVRWATPAFSGVPEIVADPSWLSVNRSCFCSLPFSVTEGVGILGVVTMKLNGLPTVPEALFGLGDGRDPWAHADILLGFGGGEIAAVARLVGQHRGTSPAPVKVTVAPVTEQTDGVAEENVTPGFPEPPPVAVTV